MEIKLVRTFIRSLKLESFPTDQEGGTPSESLKMGPIYREDCPTEFVQAYDLKVPLKPGAFLLELQLCAVFETTEPITDEFKASHFPRVNAAAVGYPYLRGFVSQFSVLAGFDPYTLGVRNFVKQPPPSLPPETLPSKTDWQ